MASRMISELNDANGLLSNDFIPVARGSSTLRLRGSALISREEQNYNEQKYYYNEQKYYFSINDSFTISPSCNNMMVVLSGQTNLTVNLNVNSSSFFPLGFGLTFLSINESTTINFNFPSVGSDYGYVDWQTTENFRSSFITIGDTDRINTYQIVKIMHVYPGIWTKGLRDTTLMPIIPGSNPQGSDISLLQPVDESTYYDNLQDTNIPPIDTTGAILTIVLINGEPLKTITYPNNSYISIQGENAYL